MDLDELLRLEAQATPGPWQPYTAYSGESGTPDEVGIYAGAGTTHHGSEKIVISDWTLYGTDVLPDLEFIAAIRNAAPDLLGAARREAGLRAAAEAVINDWLSTFGPDGYPHDMPTNLRFLRDRLAASR